MLNKDINSPINQKNSGLAAVELAIVAPLFMVLIFSVIELGIVLMDKALISAASREAARSAIAYSSSPLSDAQIKTIAQNYASNLINFGSATVNVTVTHPAADTVGTPLSVSVSFTYDSLVLFKVVSLFKSNGFPSSLVLNETTTMYMEQ